MSRTQEPIGVALVFTLALAGLLASCFEIALPEPQPEPEDGAEPAPVAPPDFGATTDPQLPAEPVTPGEVGPVRPVTPGTTALVDCAFDGEGAASGVMAVLVDDEIRLLRADGTQDLVHTLGTAWAGSEETWVSGTLQARGDYAAVSHVAGLGPVGPYSSPTSYGSEIVLFDSNGTALARTTREGTAYGYYSLFLNERGELLALNGTTALLLTPDGSVVTFEDTHPMTEVLADGSFLSYVYETLYGPIRYEWVNVRSGERTSLDPQPAGAYAFHAVGGRVTFIDQTYLDETGRGQTQLVVYEGSREIQRVTLDLPEDTWSTDLLDLVEAGHALVGSPYGAERWLADLPNGRVEPLSLVLPAGYEMMYPPVGYYYVPPQPIRLDEDGAILVGLHDGELGRLHRTDDGGTTWTPIGGTVAASEFVYGIGVGGTYLIQTDTMAYGYGADPEAPEGPEPQVGPGQTQVVRPSAGVAWVLPGSESGLSQWESQLTEDGRCLAYWQSDEAGLISLASLEVESGRQVSLLTLDPAAGEGASGRAAAWFHGSRRHQGLWYY